jgi:dsRNA-specific ribonuclease
MFLNKFQFTFSKRFLNQFIFKNYATRTEKSEILYENNSEDEITKISEILGLKGKKQFLKQALTHVTHDSFNNSSRFTFIGRMALQMYCSEYFIKKYPGMSETKFMTVESLYTNRMRLYLIARDDWKLESFHKTGTDFLKFNDERKKKALADVVHSIVGSIYHEFGPTETKDFIQTKLIETHSPMELYQNLIRQDPLFALTEMKLTHGRYPSILTEKLNSGKYKTTIYLFTIANPLGHSEANTQEESVRLAALSALLSFGKLIPDF